MATGLQGWLMAGAGAATAGAVAVGALLLWPGEMSRPSSEAVPLAAAPATSAPGADAGAASGAASGAAPALPDASEPRFDHVRIEADGRAVIAGRAAPGALVTLLVDGAPVAEETAGPTGQFALITRLPLSQERQQLELVVEQDGARKTAVLFVEPLPGAAPGPDVLGAAVPPLDSPQLPGSGDAAPGGAESAGAPAADAAPGDTPTSDSVAAGPAASDAPAVDGTGGEAAADAVAAGPEAAGSGSAGDARDGETAAVTDQSADGQADPVGSGTADGLAALSDGSAASSEASGPGQPDGAGAVPGAENAGEEPLSVASAGTAPAGAESDKIVAGQEVLAPDNGAEAVAAGAGPAPDPARGDNAVAPPAADLTVADASAPDAPPADQPGSGRAGGADSGQGADVIASKEPLAAGPQAGSGGPTPGQPASPDSAGQADQPGAEPVAIAAAPRAGQPGAAPAEPADGEGPLPQTDPAPRVTVGGAPDPAQAVAEGTAPAAAAAAATGAGAERPQPPRVLLADESGVRVLQSGEPPQVESQGVALDSIAYAPDGAVMLAGRGGADRYVRIYVDNSEIVTAAIGADGHWQTDLPDVDKGVYTLRVDELTAGGDVVSRTETPFQREDAAAVAAEFDAAAGDSPQPVTVVVQPGNTLWGISRGAYGRGSLYVRVFEANRSRIRNPHLIYPGQVFDMPAVPR